MNDCKHEPLYSIDPCPALPSGSLVRVGMFGPGYVCRLCGSVYVTAEEIARIQKRATEKPAIGVRTRIPVDDGLVEQSRRDLAARSHAIARCLSDDEKTLLVTCENDEDEGYAPEPGERAAFDRLLGLELVRSDGHVTLLGGDVLDELERLRLEEAARSRMIDDMTGEGI